jgi:hypothetical protein
MTPKKKSYVNIFPLSFAIPDECVVKEEEGEDELTLLMKKKRAVSEMIPNDNYSYKFDYDEEHLYYQQYQESWFAHTWKKGGWDCMRHYEILANGCIPLFRDLEECPAETLTTLTKTSLANIYNLMNLIMMTKEPPQLDHLHENYLPQLKFIRKQLLEHTRKNCTTSALAHRFLSRISLSSCQYDGDAKKILLIGCHPGENYLRESLTIGLRRLLGPERFVEYPRYAPLYSDFDCRANKAYGRGFSYARRLRVPEDDCTVESRTDVAAKILKREYTHIIYGKVGVDEQEMGSYWLKMPFWREVQAAKYAPHEISFLYGEDRMHRIGDDDDDDDDELRRDDEERRTMNHVLLHAQHGNVFLREFEKIQ